MAYDARQIANWFVREGGKHGKYFSIMELLKLVYITHGWHLEIFSTPLFSNRIEAWKFGPVIPDVYSAFRPQGVTVNQPVMIQETPVAPQVEKLLGEIYNIYGGMQAFKLSEITHEGGGPWDTVSRTKGFFGEIDDRLIRDHYRQKRNDVAEAS
jgi:uncharacterized phage-associated protein